MVEVEVISKSFAGCIVKYNRREYIIRTKDLEEKNGKYYVKVEKLR